MNVTETINNILSHHGVKGQQWGVRKKRGSPSADSQKHSTNVKKHVSELDDKELQSLVQRMNMEQQHGRLNPSKIAKGHNVVKTILAVGATVNAAIAFHNSPFGQKLAGALTKGKKLG